MFSALGYTKLILRFMDYLPSQRDPRGQEKLNSFALFYTIIKTTA